MVSQNLLQGLSQGENPVAQAFDARTQQLEQKRAAEQKAIDDKQRQHDQDMLKVFEFAGDGYVDEARYFAQQKGLQVPESIYGNADMAKGLSLAGKIYGDDAAAAQKFTTAWMGTQGDMNTRLLAAQKAAGAAVNPEDRQLQKQIALENWKLKNRVGGSENNGFSLSPGQTRYNAAGGIIASAPAADDNGEYEAYSKAYNAAISSGLMSQEEAQQAGENAAAQYRLYNQRPAAPPPSGNIQPAMTSAPTPAGQQNKGVYAVQQMLLPASAGGRGLTPDQVMQGLIQRGATEQQARQLLNAAGVN